MSATSAPVRPEPAPEPELSLAVPPEPRRAPLAHGLVLAAIFVAAAAYHALNSLWHVTPAVFIDELLYSKLAQSVAAGDGIAVRGEPVFFPGLLPVLAQAPAWLVPDAGSAYALAKALNAVVMSAAAFPAYWLARQLVRPAWALLAAALTVSAPGMLYHAYLMSEAVAYPVFLLALAVMLRALSRPSRGWELAVVAVCLLAVLARAQFAALPLAYIVAVPLGARLSGGSAREALRRHRLSTGGLALGGLLVLVTGGAALGPYIGAALLDYPLADVGRLGVATAALLPFSAGWLLVPGALLGLAYLLGRPATRPEAGFAVLASVSALLTLLEISLVAGGQAERPLERYAIYLVPLGFVAFFAYAERGAPRRRAYAAVALALGLLAWLVPFPALAPGLAGYSFSFDSPALSAYGTLAMRLGHPNAATVFSGGAFSAGLVLAALPLRRRVPAALAGASLAALLLAGAAAYAGDRAMTKGTLAAWAGAPPDWLDRSRLGRADYVALPGGSPHFGYVLETWNRSFGRPILLGVPETDPFPSARARIGRRGELLLGGRPAGAGLLVVNDYGTALELEGDVVARPRTGLTLYRVGPEPRVRSLAIGLFADGWARNAVRYQIWRRRPAAEGVYRVRLELPPGLKARRVTLAVDGGVRRIVPVAGGESRLVELAVRGHPVPVLRIRSDGTDFLDADTPNPRLVGVRIPVLEYVPHRTSISVDKSRSRAA